MTDWTLERKCWLLLNRICSSPTCASFNKNNIDRLPPGIKYGAVAADADNNGDQTIYGSELRGMHAEDRSLWWMDVVAYEDNAVTFAYSTLRNTSRIHLRYFMDWITLPHDPEEIPIQIEVEKATIDAINGGPNDNDTAVTTASGVGIGSWDLLTDTRFFEVRTGLQKGRNHASVADQDVAKLVSIWLLDVERSQGDLR